MPEETYEMHGEDRGDVADENRPIPFFATDDPIPWRPTEDCTELEVP